MASGVSFKICLPDGTQAGVCDLRIGHNEGVYYGGNIGYGVGEPHRGRHYAGKACLLLFQLAKKHGMDYLYITCNPENTASRKTCEYAGGVLEGVVDSREYYGLYIKYYITVDGQTVKVIEKNDGVNIYEAGQKVTVVIDPRDVMSYPAGAAE